MQTRLNACLFLTQIYLHHNTAISTLNNLPCVLLIDPFPKEAKMFKEKNKNKNTAQRKHGIFLGLSTTSLCNKFHPGTSSYKKI